MEDDDSKYVKKNDQDHFQFLKKIIHFTIFLNLLILLLSIFIITTVTMNTDCKITAFISELVAIGSFDLVIFVMLFLLICFRHLANVNILLAFCSIAINCIIFGMIIVTYIHYFNSTVFSIEK